MKWLGVIALTLAAGSLAGEAAAKKSGSPAKETAAAASPSAPATASASTPASAPAPATASASVPQAPSPSAAAEEAHTETPLNVRAAKPLTLNEAPSTSGGWKIVVLAACAGIGVWAWKRRGKTPIKKVEAELAIVKRASVGMRSELLIVRVDGQRILLGVTPTAIQMLTTLSNDADEAAVESADALEAAIAPPKSFAAVLETSVQDAPAPRPQISAKAAVEGQARGLLALSQNAQRR